MPGGLKPCSGPSALGGDACSPRPDGRLTAAPPAHSAGSEVNSAARRSALTGEAGCSEQQEWGSSGIFQGRAPPAQTTLGRVVSAGQGQGSQSLRSSWWLVLQDVSHFHRKLELEKRKHVSCDCCHLDQPGGSMSLLPVTGQPTILLNPPPASSHLSQELLLETALSPAETAVPNMSHGLSALDWQPPLHAGGGEEGMGSRVCPHPPCALQTPDRSFESGLGDEEARAQQPGGMASSGPGSGARQGHVSPANR